MKFFGVFLEICYLVSTEIIFFIRMSCLDFCNNAVAIICFSIYIKARSTLCLFCCIKSN